MGFTSVLLQLTDSSNRFDSLTDNDRNNSMEEGVEVGEEEEVIDPMDHTPLPDFEVTKKVIDNTHKLV